MDEDAGSDVGGHGAVHHPLIDDHEDQVSKQTQHETQLRNQHQKHTADIFEVSTQQEERASKRIHSGVKWYTFQMVIQLFVMLVLSRKCLDQNDNANWWCCWLCKYSALYSCPMTAALGHVKNQNALYNENIYQKKTTKWQDSSASKITISVSHRLLMCHISHKN